MSADSQRVEILGGANHPSSGVRRRNPILIREGGGFVGLVGFAGTEQVDGMATRDWLARFNNQRTNDDVGTYCRRLADTLTTVWQRDGLNSVLEILVAGEVSGDLQFWFVRNSQGLRNADWLHEAPASVFVAENDLDANYIPKYQQPGETKDAVLDRVTLSFRQGVLIPAAPVFDAFARLLGAMSAGGIAGLAPLASLDEVGHFARMRMEFLKRLCDSSYGIYAANVPFTVGGVVYVYGVGRKGEIRKYKKGKNQIESVHGGRP